MNVAELGYDERLRLAEDPAATAELLGRLYADAEDRYLDAFMRAITGSGIDREGAKNAEEIEMRETVIRRAVAAHPNAPRHILAEAITDHPDSFCRNPSAPLLVVEDPSVVGSLETKDLRGVLSRADVPASLLHALYAVHRDGGSWLADEITMHVGIAGDAPDDGWQTEVWNWIRRAATILNTRQQDELRLLVAHGCAPEELLPPGTAPLSKPGAVDEIIRQAHFGASVGTTPLFRLLVASNPELTGPDELLLMIAARCEPPWVARLGVALNPNLRRVSAERIRFWPLEDGNRLVRAAARARLRRPEGSLLW